MKPRPTPRQFYKDGGTVRPGSPCYIKRKADDELYDAAVALVAEMGQASTSMVQRKLRIGYNRAARLIERMEKEGVVGPADGARPREVLVRDHKPEQPAA